MKRLIFLGPPGAGKGTQAKLLAAKTGIAHISTGEMLRSAISSGTTLGKQAQTYVDKGELVPDQLLLDLIRARLREPDAKNGWILDGFPRNASQAAFLDKLLMEMNQACDYAINLEVPEQVLMERLVGRGRKDDNPETIRRRLEVYHEHTAPVLDFYLLKGNLKSVNGDRPLEEVNKSLQEIVNGGIRDLK
ncbi:MAG: adenylate kinase [Prochloron sp. SP5CPC1]|nr:adenylate kinase [Candidatus Paraprochloron terpiosi SP5CPC1]